MRDMNFKKYAALAFWIIIGAELQAQAATFTYRLYDFPKSDSLNCEAAAKNLGDLVAQIANVQVKSAICSSEFRDAYAIVVTYEAASRLNVVTTSLSSPNTFGNGIYRSIAECRADLPRQIDQFKKSTGLNPIVHYCSDTGWSDNYPIRLRIEGFGTPDVRPFNFSKHIFGVPVYASRAVASINARAAEAGMTMIGSAVAGVFGDSRIDIIYYASQRYEMFDKLIAEFNKPEQCEVQAQALEATTPASKLLGAYCLYHEVYEMYHLHKVGFF